MKAILQYSDLVGIPVKDCGEPLLIVQTHAPEIICQYEKLDMVPYLGDSFLLREEALNRLKKAATSLRITNPILSLRLVYAYRHPDIQSAYFEERKKQILQDYPTLSQNELIARTHLLTASPDVAGHPTGGAIDVTIGGPEGMLEMGSAIADFTSDKIEIFSNDLTETQQTNRALLRRVLMDAGFAPFDGEWWHFSYGDREWAAYYNQPNAIYDQVAYTK